jgi:hypothetical protein
MNRMMKRVLIVLASVMVAAFVVEDAGAIVGRPLTPMSYAGVARRTTRRAAYVGAATAAAAPAYYAPPPAAAYW